MFNFHTAQKKSVASAVSCVYFQKKRCVQLSLRLYASVINYRSLLHMAHFAHVSYCNLFNEPSEMSPVYTTAPTLYLFTSRCHKADLWLTECKEKVFLRRPALSRHFCRSNALTLRYDSSPAAELTTPPHTPP